MQFSCVTTHFLFDFRQVEPEMAGRAGMMMAFFLVLGITTGVNFSLILQKIVTVSS